MTSRLRKLGLTAHIIFSVGWLGCERIGEGLEAHFSWNYTAVLDCAAITWAGWLGFLHLRQQTRQQAQLTPAHENHHGHG